MIGLFHISALFNSNYEKDAVKDQIKKSPYISTGTYAAKAMEEILPKFQEHQRDGDDIARVRLNK